MPPTPNVVLFGRAGSGKSSIINMIAGSPVAESSSGATSCTFTSACYNVDIMGSHYNVYDTVGIDEGVGEWTPNTGAMVQLFRLLRSLDTGVNLLVFVMRASRLQDSMAFNWRLFCEIICCRRVPAVIAITGLENESVMDEWYPRNIETFQQYGIHPHGVACITATRGRIRRSGHVFDEEYEESKQKIKNLLMMNRLEYPWRVEPVEWFTTIVHVTRQGRSAKEHRTYEKVAGPGIKELTDRCELSLDTAKRLADLLSG